MSDRTSYIKQYLLSMVEHLPDDTVCPYICGILLYELFVEVLQAILTLSKVSVYTLNVEALYIYCVYNDMYPDITLHSYVKELNAWSHCQSAPTVTVCKKLLNSYDKIVQTYFNN